MSDRWNYKVMEVSPSMWGRPSMTEKLNDELNRWGKQGWELVSSHQLSPYYKVRLILKKEY